MEITLFMLDFARIEVIWKGIELKLFQFTLMEKGKLEGTKVHQKPVHQGYSLPFVNGGTNRYADCKLK